MTIHRNEYGNRRKAPINTGGCGVVIAVPFDFTLTEDYVASTDIIEFGVVPAGCKVIDVDGAGNGWGTGLTAAVGYMSGKVGADTNDDGSPRTCGNQFFPALDIDPGNASMTVANKMTQTVDYDNDRSIGAIISANQTAGGETLRLIVKYMAVR
ncbi:hypothetical protein [Mesobacterium pallidum]|uniref:hypothetical protein n=1 Tax=Mesobacterium pallidum TaxID=2872037 RepID=UPI001EE27393|nr:hypothetical protein [Mesobacterium pallidum]